MTEAESSALDGDHVTRAESSALDVFLDGDTAMAEQRAGHALEQRPRVGAGVKGLHVSQGWALAAHHPSCGVDLSIQDRRTGGAGKMTWNIMHVMLQVHNLTDAASVQ